jgi:hypothetical protein
LEDGLLVDLDNGIMALVQIMSPSPASVSHLNILIIEEIKNQ